MAKLRKLHAWNKIANNFVIFVSFAPFFLSLLLYFQSLFSVFRFCFQLLFVYVICSHRNFEKLPTDKKLNRFERETLNERERRRNER